MLRAILIVVLLVTLGPPIEGKAVYYAPSWDWSRIARNQGVRIPPGATPVATWDCRMLGAIGWLQLSDSRPIRIVIADCTAPEDLPLVRSRRIVAEVPYPVAERYGFVRQGWVKARLWLPCSRTSPAGRQQILIRWQKPPVPD